MGTAKNALFQYEQGQTPAAGGGFVALTDDGDHLYFRSAARIWSLREGFAPDIRPDGVVSGGVVVPAASGGNNKVDVRAVKSYVAGALVSVAAELDAVCTRAADTDTHIINSITLDDGAIVVVPGTDGTAFSETRGAAGGPPLIPVGAVEVAQIRLSSQAAAPIEASEIFQVPGVHLERWDYPGWTENPIKVTDRMMDYAGVTFDAALPPIHTGDIPKAVYAKYSTPVFVAIAKSENFVPAETSHSISSSQLYGRMVGVPSSSLGQGSIVVHLENGVSDMFLGLKNQRLWTKFFPNRLKAEHLLMNAILGIARQFPAGGSIVATCQLSVELDNLVAEVIG